MSDELIERVAHLFRTMYATEADRRIAADAAIALIRAETLEEAARVAIEEYRKSSSGEEIAAAIRAALEERT